MRSVARRALPARLVLLVLVAVLGFAHSVSAREPLFPDIETIKERGELVVALVKSDEPPLFSVDEDGKLSGFSVRLAETIAGRLGVRLRYDRSAATYDDLIALLVTGDADISLAGVTPTPERSLLVRFTQPLVSASLTALVNRVRGIGYRGCPTVAELGELARREHGVGVVEQGATAARLRSAVDAARLQTWPTVSDVFRAAAEGKVVAAVGSEVEARYFLDRNPARRVGLALCTFPSLADPLAVAVRPDAPGLVTWLDILLLDAGAPIPAERLVREAGRWQFGWRDQFPQPEAKNGKAPGGTD